MLRQISIFVFTVILTGSCTRDEKSKTEVRTVTYSVSAPGTYSFHYTGSDGKQYFSGLKQGYQQGGGATEITEQIPSGSRVWIFADKDEICGTFLVEIHANGKEIFRRNEDGCLGWSIEYKDILR